MSEADEAVPDDVGDFERPTPPPIERPVLHVEPSSPLGRTFAYFDNRLDRIGRRFGKKLDDQEKVLTEHRLWKVGLVGEKGDNGKIGNLANDVAAIKRERSRIVAAVAASIVAAALAIYQAGIKRGEDASRLDEAQAEIVDLKSQLATDQQLRSQLLLRLLMLTPGLVPGMPTTGGSP